MAAGRQLTKDTINADAGSIARSVFAGLNAVVQFKTWLDSITDANLIAVYGFLQADVDDLRSGFSDLNQLSTIFNGTANLAVAKDFRAFAKRLNGDGLF